jgi:cobalamin biosynthesis Mg chelatase CobN
MSEQEKEDPPIDIGETVGTVAEKKKKPYVWTAKRKEAFEKMRQSLDEKNELTKQLKKEKEIAEKEEIKKRVRAIMKSTKMEKKMEEESNSSSEEEVEEKPKKSKKGKKEKVEIRKKKEKRKKVESSSSESDDDDSSVSSASSIERPKESYSKRMVDKYRHEKEKVGKTAKHATYVNPLDRFILL